MPPAWLQYVGGYGPAFIPLVVSIHHGHLYALIENEYDYRLMPTQQQVEWLMGKFSAETVDATC